MKIKKGKRGLELNPGGGGGGDFSKMAVMGGWKILKRNGGEARNGGVLL